MCSSDLVSFALSPFSGNMRTGFIFALPMMATSMHPELEGAITPEEKFAIFSSTTSQSLLSSLPDELRGDNMTLANFQKYFTYTLTYNGKPIAPRTTPRALLSRRTASLRGDGKTLINAGEFVWAMIDKNQPVSDLAGLGHFASGVPSDISFSEISFEKNPHFEPKGTSSDYPEGKHHFTWTGGLKNTACEIKFRNYWIAHGTRKGHKDGYLDQATQLVDYGHAGGVSKLTADVSVAGPTNVGKGDPVAELTFKLHLQCDNMDHYMNYIVRGDGTFQDLDAEFVEV